MLAASDARFRGFTERATLRRLQHGPRAAHMQEATQQPTIVSGAADPLVAAAFRAEAWAGEPFLRDGENPAEALAPKTARRRALDDAIAEIEAGRARPTPQWKVRYGLMLGLERVLAEPTPRTAAGTELRRHQVDALAGMLTELIAATQRDDEHGLTGTATATRSPRTSWPRSRRRRRTRTRRSSSPRCPTARTRRSRSSRSCRRSRTRAPSAATASATPPRPARRSPPPASSRPPARSASSSSRTAGCSSRSSTAT